MYESLTPLDKTALAITASILMACGAHAYDLTLGTNIPPVTFHGFASQGFLDTSHYNYLAPDTKDGSFQYSEAGVNLSMNPFPRTHIAIQGFLYDEGDLGKYQPFLDYASVEYTFSDYLGLRAGRVRRPAGIYNDIQDIDLARTFVLLPQGVYDSRYRDLSCSVDGGEIFGATSLSKAGSLSYEFYGGADNVSTDDGVAKIVDNAAGGNATSFDTLFTVGGQLWWDTPVDGLRFGSSLEEVYNFNYDLDVPTGYPPPYPATIGVSSKGSILIQQYSAEYLWKNWTFQSEYYNTESSSDATSPAGASHNYNFSYSWYGSAAYRVNKWLQIGTYYNESYESGTHPVASDGSQKDLALAFRFDPEPWWVIKVEGHYLRGTALLDDNGANPVRNGDGWFMLALKTTVSF
jgi:hypothetical protein